MQMDLVAVDQLPNLDVSARVSIIELMITQFVMEHMRAKGVNDFNISPKAMLLLGRMALHTGPMRPTDLRRFGYYTGGQVSYTLKQLVKTGYVTSSDPNHVQRSRTLALTEKGCTLGSDVALVLDYVERNLAAMFPIENFKRMREFLDMVGHQV